MIMQKYINRNSAVLLFVLLGSMASVNAQMLGGMPIFNKPNTFLNLKSCKEIKDAIPTATDGVYTIDPDGSGSAFGAMQIYCDMTRNGGGWTLIAKSMTANSDFVYWSSRWDTGQVLNPNDFDISSTGTINSLYDAYNSVVATQAWVDFLSNPDPGILTKSSAMTAKSMATSGEYINWAWGCGDCSPFISCDYTNGRGAWAQGFNIYSPVLGGIRFGHVSNNEIDFITIDCATGFGLNRNAGHSSGDLPQGCGTNDRPIDNADFKTLLWVR